MAKKANERRKIVGARQPNRKATKAEVMLRVNTVIDLLCGGMTRSNIINYVETKWGLGWRSAENYIRMATKVLIEENDAIDLKIERGKAIRRLNLVFKQCMVAQDYGRAISAQRELNSLLGLNAPQKVTVYHQYEERLTAHGLTLQGALDLLVNELDKQAGVEVLQ